MMVIIMNNEYSKIGLYPHNIKSYKKIKEAFNNEEKVVGIVQATGTGKSYQALQLALDNVDKKIIYIVPSNSIIEHLESIIENNPNLDKQRDFPNLEFRTYQSLVDLSREELENLDIDLLILDEFHHIGAPIWGARINEIINTHKNINIFGMTAYTIRDRGTIYERDMANPEGNELFSNKIVNRYDLVDAMIDEVLPRPVYKSAYIHLFGLQKDLEDKVLNGNINSKEKEQYLKILEDIKRRLQQAPGTKELILKNIKPNGKYIYFCPVGTDIDTIMNEAKEWFSDYNQDDIIFYKSTSEMKEQGKYNRDCFYNNKTLDEKDASNKLKIIFAINQYNEGVHAPNVDGVILGRTTSSDIVYFEQIGRALAVKGNNQNQYELYNKLSLEALLLIAKNRDITIKENISKEELINKLIAPVIIDLSNNIDFIKELENNLQDRIKEYRKQSNPKSKRIINPQDFLFDIDIENQDLFNILSTLRDRLYPNRWDYMYSLAKAYYEHYGDSNIPFRFKTTNGYTFDEDGSSLGQWIHNQRQGYENLTEDRKKMLKEINFIKNQPDYQWQRNYELTKAYYEHYGDSNIPSRFKTTNGYNYDESGIKLGRWISKQRTYYKNNKLLPEKKELLEQIGMCFENIADRLPWEEMYGYAKIYYEYYGDLNIPFGFKTTNGYDWDESGIKLGRWISNQTYRFKATIGASQLLKSKEFSQKDTEFLKKVPTLSDEQITSLLSIGIVLDKNNNAIKNKSFFETYGITDKKIISLLIKKSNLELSIIENYLIDNNIPIQKNGIFHEMFFMTGIQMKEKYGFYKSELMYRYLSNEKQHKKR